MKSVLLSVVAILLLGAPIARGDVIVPPPPPPPKPPAKPAPEPDPVPVVVGAVAAVGLLLAGVWLVRSRRRIPVPTEGT